MSRGLQSIVMGLMEGSEDDWITSSQTELVLEGLEQDRQDLPYQPPTPAPSCDEGPVQTLEDINRDAILMDLEWQNFTNQGKLPTQSKVVTRDCDQYQGVARSSCSSPQDLGQIENTYMCSQVQAMRYTPPPPYPHPHAMGDQSITDSVPTSRCTTPDYFTNMAPSIKVERKRSADSLSESSPSPQCPRLDSNDLQQRVTPLIKLELRNKITTRRRQQGLEPRPELDTPSPMNCELSETDIIRKERRKASNRRAAAKCRNRKQKEEKAKAEEYKNTKIENAALREEVQRLRKSNRELESKLAAHRKQCGLTFVHQDHR